MTDAIVSERTGTRWVPVVGLEVHCQLGTPTKLFCDCANEFGAPPNSHVCPVCTGQPGALPVLSADAVRLAVRAALALGCEVANESAFDRKNYFYCDLPKGYQISQLHRPYSRGGGITLASGKRVRLNRIHMEEDAGKAIHDRGASTLVDLNRAGVPLIESVTEADLTSADEAVEYLSALKEILQYVGASDCDMEKGSLRCDVNVSVHPEGEPWRAKVELKNLNSFRNVKAAIEHELERQVAAWESDDPAERPVQETRSFDPDTGRSRPMRSKEDAHDYRYFRDPDLPVLVIEESLLEGERGALPELPAARRERYAGELGLGEYDAGVLASDREVSDFFDAVVALGSAPKDATNWITNELLGARNERGPEATLADVGVTPEGLHELLALVANGKLTKKAARQVLAAMMETGRAADVLVAELGLEQVSDESQLVEWCREALVGRDDTIADVRAGKTKAIGALVGPVMKASKGRADARRVQEILLELIEADGGDG